MRDWLMGWSRRVRKIGPNAKSPAATPASLAWELPAAPLLRWTPAEMQALLDCEQQKTICAIVEQDREAPRQTVVLGCDPAGHQILLDDFFPRPEVSPIGGSFQLQLPMGTELLRLQVVVRDEIGVAPIPAYVAEVVGKVAVEDRRFSQRLQFTDVSAPQVDLLLPFSSRVRGHLRDLSESGFAMVYYGASTPQLFTYSGECCIDFDERFTLRAKVEVQQVRARRKPCHHTHIRVRFRELSALDRERIGTFIDNCRHGADSLSKA